MTACDENQFTLAQVHTIIIIIIVHCIVRMEWWTPAKQLNCAYCTCVIMPLNIRQICNNNNSGNGSSKNITFAFIFFFVGRSLDSTSIFSRNILSHLFLCLAMNWNDQLCAREYNFIWSVRRSVFFFGCAFVVHLRKCSSPYMRIAHAHARLNCVVRNVSSIRWPFWLIAEHSMSFRATKPIFAYVTDANTHWTYPCNYLLFILLNDVPLTHIHAHTQS